MHTRQDLLPGYGLRMHIRQYLLPGYGVHMQIRQYLLWFAIMQLTYFFKPYFRGHS